MRACLYRWASPAVGLMILASCGGTAVVDGQAAEGGGDGATSTATGGTTSSTTTATGTNTAACVSHADCPDGVCLFATGQCADRCAPESCDSCGPAMFCEPCASSSCADCQDCVAACLPAAPERCDEDDPCPGAQLCQWAWGTCLPPCGPNGDCGAFAFCDDCATSSGCGNKDCVAACMGGE